MMERVKQTVATLCLSTLTLIAPLDSAAVVLAEASQTVGMGEIKASTERFARRFVNHTTVCD